MKMLNLALAVAFQTLSERDHFFLMLDFLGTAINLEAQILTEGGCMRCKVVQTLLPVKDVLLTLTQP